MDSDFELTEIFYSDEWKEDPHCGHPVCTNIHRAKVRVREVLFGDDIFLQELDRIAEDHFGDVLTKQTDRRAYAYFFLLNECVALPIMYEVVQKMNEQEFHNEHRN